ncbi:8-amino-7-oxononanoate synthase [Verrucomicrobia bacterium]|nr:8-amino-7-oxononanoate synthase [Verrucomicrobiota bacterium]
MTPPHAAFADELNQRLETLRQQGLYRQLRPIASPQSPRLEVEGDVLLNFSSNDYLGLANHPVLRAAAIEAVERYGAGSGASRLVCGSLAPHQELEERLAAFKGAPAALVFSSGYTAALGALGALLGKDDVVIIDRLAHACLVDAARLCGAKLRVFGHNDANDLERILKWTQTTKAGSSSHPRVLIVTESVFSMDGDQAPLREIADLKDKYGAWLMVDEAHATGLYGAHRRGLAEALGVSNLIEVHMGTLGKTLGASGGYICGSRPLIDVLINRARTFIFSTAPVPAASAAATAGVRLVQSPEGEGRLNSLWQRVREVTSILKSPGAQLPSAIIPLRIGDETRALEAAAALRGEGIYLPAIRYPAVARGQARLRLTLTAAHTAADTERLARALRKVRVGIEPVPS